MCLDGEVLFPGRACSAGGAERALELPVHVNEPPGAGSLMQRVDVLGDGQYMAMLPLKPRQRQMRCIRLCSFVPATAEIVEVMDANRIAREGFWRRYVLDPKVLPEPAGAAKCAEPAFGGEPLVRMTMLLKAATIGLRWIKNCGHKVSVELLP